jgi:hypothetical protein
VRKTLIAAASTIAVALLAACSGGSQGSMSTIPGGANSLGHSHGQQVSPSGIAPKFLGMQRFHQTAHGHGVKTPGGAKSLYVDDVGTNAVDVLANNSWTFQSSFNGSINGPDGNWADKKGRVYVANYAGSYVTEYDKSGNLLFTYSSGVSDAVGVSTDKKGNVFEADFVGNYVNEYAQQSNTVVATCYPGGYVEGVAVNKKGDVFVDWTDFYTGYITEYAGGLAGCNGTVLGATVGFPGGMVLDKHNNLVICDQYSGVDIIAPPYNTVSSQLASGFYDPFHVTLSKNNKQAYVADAGTGYVTVLSYPGGSTLATLNSSNGITFAYSAVDGKNFVP